MQCSEEFRVVFGLAEPTRSKSTTWSKIRSSSACASRDLRAPARKVRFYAKSAYRSSSFTGSCCVDVTRTTAERLDCLRVSQANMRINLQRDASAREQVNNLSNSNSASLKDLELLAGGYDDAVLRRVSRRLWTGRTSRLDRKLRHGRRSGVHPPAHHAIFVHLRERCALTPNQRTDHRLSQARAASM